MTETLVQRMQKLRDSLSPINEKFGVPQYQDVVLAMREIAPAPNRKIVPSQRVKVPMGVSAVSLWLITPAPRVERLGGTYRDADYFYNSNIKIIQNALKIEKITRLLGKALETNTIEAVYVGVGIAKTLGPVRDGLRSVVQLVGDYKKYTVHTLDDSNILTYTAICTQFSDKVRG
jgi:hypothetical protein